MAFSFSRRLFFDHFRIQIYSVQYTFFFLAKFIGGHSPISSLINTIIKRQSKRKQTLVKFSYPTTLTQELKLKLYSMRNPSSKVKTNKSILYLRDHFFSGNNGGYRKSNDVLPLHFWWPMMDSFILPKVHVGTALQWNLTQRGAFFVVVDLGLNFGKT